MYNAKGELLEMKTEIQISKFPTPVTNSNHKQYPTAKLQVATELYLES